MDTLPTSDYGFPTHNITCVDGRTFISRLVLILSGSLTRFVDFLCPVLVRCLGWPELQCFWSAVVLSAGKCDGAPQRIQLQHGPGPRQVRLLRRLGVGRQLQHLHRRQFHPQEKRTAETGEEGLDASGYVSPPLVFCLITN